MDNISKNYTNFILFFFLRKQQCMMELKSYFTQFSSSWDRYSST